MKAFENLFPAILLRKQSDSYGKKSLQIVGMMCACEYRNKLEICLNIDLFLIALHGRKVVVMEKF
uniref:Uncharacterized protein n=1 Tax=Glossina pallidipes TaxID=7398 RepID=A0A1A9ZHC7_GLOPL